MPGETWFSLIYARLTLPFFPPPIHPTPSPSLSRLPSPLFSHTVTEKLTFYHFRILCTWPTYIHCSACIYTLPLLHGRAGLDFLSLDSRAAMQTTRPLPLWATRGKRTYANGRITSQSPVNSARMKVQYTSITNDYTYFPLNSTAGSEYKKAKDSIAVTSPCWQFFCDVYVQYTHQSEL